jgi:tetraacyldisaccharide 4'-kinase
MTDQTEYRQPERITGIPRQRENEPMEPTNSQPWYVNVMSGAERGPAAATLRAGLRIVEPFYSAAVRLRNRGFDRPGRARRLARPVISVGNITAGGTGKTPVVRWLAERLRAGGRNVAILSRGYKAAAGSWGDEQRMLDRLLNHAGMALQRAAPLLLSPGTPGEGSGELSCRNPDYGQNTPHPNPLPEYWEREKNPGGVDLSVKLLPPVLLYADPDRHAAGERAASEHPEIDVFLLDDGFQHRRLARDMDLVLIRATEPFGYGHLLPRGLLREPLSGLGRANAFVLTHADGVDAAERKRITGELRRHNPAAPIFAAVHAPVAIRFAPSAGGPEQQFPLERLRGVRAFAFCGIGNPGSFERDLRSRCGNYVGHRWFIDHHAYTPADLHAVQEAARKGGADVLITTEKDWVKLAELPRASGGLPIWRLDIAASFLDGDDQRLLERVEQTIDVARRPA